MGEVPGTSYDVVSAENLNGDLRPRCGARTKTRKGTCRMGAGHRTDHEGVGKCYLHGGRTPIKHGRYSSIKRLQLRELIEAHEADPDPLNILPELAAARALFQDFIERYDTWRESLLAWHLSYKNETDTPKPQQVLDIGDAYRIVSEVTKIAERIERIRAANAISRPELFRIMSEMGRVVLTYIDDPEVRDKIRHDWLAIRV